ncbi:MAG: TonB-dependent receptor [Myxococcota bacterium]|nr:TonB-dependent receptor [Myxococcota bacterium]
MRFHCGQVLALLGLLGLSGLAAAAPRDDAKRHFIAGLQAAQEARYAEALDHFLAAQNAYPHPATLYNIARAYTDLKDYEQAIYYYELYGASAGPEKAAEVQPVIDVLRAQMGVAAPGSTGASGGGEGSAVSTITNRDIAELRRLASQFNTLVEAVSEREAVAARSTEPDEVTTGSDVSDIGGDFLSDAYERVIVTASRYGQSPLDSPSTISVVSGQDIRMSGATNIPDLLRRAVGVEVMSLSGGQSDVSIRGFNQEISNKVLILIDGRSVYWDILATPLWGTLPISLVEIDRIEITRGPGSAVYGANAVTGVVNIITKLPGEGENLLEIAGGQPGYGQGTIMTTGRKEKSSYRVAAGWHQTGRWSTIVDPELHSSTIVFADDDNESLNILRANARLDRAFLDKGLISLSGGYLTGMTEFYPFGALGNYLIKNVQSGYGRVDLAYDRFQLRVFYNKLGGDSADWNSYSEDKQLDTQPDSNTVDLEFTGLQELETGSVKHKISYGLGHRFKQVYWNYLGSEEIPITEDHYSAFLQEDARIDRLSLVGAFRVDRHPLVDLAKTISPRAAAVFRATDTTSVRLTGGTSFRSPALIESYTQLNQPNANEADGIFLTTYGNEDLVPERILTGEVGVRDESSNIHTADVTAYVNRVTDIIGLSDVQPSLEFYNDEVNGFRVGTSGFINLDSVYYGYGLEMDAHLFPVNGLDVHANLHLQSVIEDTGTVRINNEDASAVKVNMDVAYASPWRLDISGGFHYLSAQEWRLREFDENGLVQIQTTGVPARFIPTARIAVRPLQDDSLEASATIWNPAGLTEDGRFREHPKGQLVGGRLYGSLTYRF